MENILIYNENVYCVPLEEFETIRDSAIRGINYHERFEGSPKKFVKPCEMKGVGCEYLSSLEEGCLYCSTTHEPGNLFDWKILTDKNELLNNLDRCVEEDNKVLHRIYQGCFDNFLI